MQVTETIKYVGVNDHDIDLLKGSTMFAKTVWRTTATLLSAKR